MITRRCKLGLDWSYDLRGGLGLHSSLFFWPTTAGGIDRGLRGGLVLCGEITTQRKCGVPDLANIGVGTFVKEIPLQSSTIEHTEHNQESTLSAGWKVVMPVKAILMIYLALNSLYEEWAVCHTIICPRNTLNSHESGIMEYSTGPIQAREIPFLV
ncbi:hypothetical protein C8J57DRAFT_1244225 [Mycena rebaudengoi]|nr:hypothetical protein C8J57DRAFT_1244225 [Mycena rebaudengoi]